MLLLGLYLFVCGFAVLLIKWLLYCRLPTCVLVMCFVSFVGVYLSSG